MKITNIIGSPRRNSNSAKISSVFCETAEKNGAKVNTYVLNTMDYKGCQGCYACKMTKDICILKDDLESVLKEIQDTDVLVVSAPVYIMDVPGQVKLFIDRMWSFIKPDFLTNPNPGRLSQGKTFLFIQTQRADETMFNEINVKYQQYFKMLGFSKAQTIRAAGFDDPNQEVSQDILKEAKRLALSLV